MAGKRSINSITKKINENINTHDIALIILTNEKKKKNYMNHYKLQYIYLT